MNEFPRLWESTIRAVMAECNQDYVRSRAKLLDISSSTWLLSNLFQLFARRQMHVPELAHPDLVEQIHSQTRERLCASDKDLAKALNQTEYESQNQLISCQCCFSDVAFEDLGHCSEGHLFCGDCIQRLVNESLFGQGTLRGQPVSCVVTEGCLGRWSDETLQRFVTPQNLELYNVMVTERELVKAGIDLIKCPFCPYSGMFAHGIFFVLGT